jgi:tetratricopeptide (TPR) repeat protein
MNTTAGTVVNALRDAARMLQAGKRDAALAIVARAVQTHPESAEAHWFLSGLQFEAGNLDAALNALRTTLKLDPGRAPAHGLLGEIMMRAGRSDEAERSFRQALVLRHDHLPAVFNLGYLLLQRQRPEEALALVDRYIGEGFRTPGLLMLKGQTLMALRDPQAATGAFEELLRLSPANIEGQIGLAAALTEGGDPRRAEQVSRHAMAGGNAPPEAHFVLARALITLNRLDEAVAALRTAVKARPDYVVAHTNLAELLWMQTGDVEAATADIDAALRTRPDLDVLRIAKGRLLEAAQQPEHAVAEMEQCRGLQRDTGSLDACIAIAQAALKFDPARALVYAQRAIRQAPENGTALTACCAALLGNGQPADASAIADRLHRSNPADCHAMALQAIAWRQLGDARYRVMYDYRCVVPSLIDTPDGWPDLEHYLADLAASLRKLHVYHAHPVFQSLRGGSQVDLDFERAEEPAIRAFARAIDGPIRRYMDGIRAGDDGWRQRHTGAYRLNGAWSVRLRPHGHHVNHVHPEGWLSSACYIELPALDDEAAHAGWIQFGQPGMITAPPLSPEHFVKPAPGLLVLFPSYMWHGTIPFEGAPGAARMTIAFDVVPA